MLSYNLFFVVVVIMVESVVERFLPLVNDVKRFNVKKSKTKTKQ